MARDERKVGRDAPVLAFDWPWESGEVLWPCARCEPWHVELFEQEPGGGTWVREWHAVGCPIWAEADLGQQIV